MFAILAKKPVPRALADYRGEVVALEKPNDEYVKVAQKIGLHVPQVDTKLEELNHFLYKNNWPVYSLDAVIPYMTKVSNRDNPLQSGWGWTALRSMDATDYLTFLGSRQGRHRETRSGHRVVVGKAVDWLNSGRNKVYNLAVPLHAIKKVEQLERAGFTPNNGFRFVVSDYAVDSKLVPNPDPFLSVYYFNASTAKTGDDYQIKRSARYVIDFWDEPGFGLAEQLK